MPSNSSHLSTELRLYIHQHFVRKGRAPMVQEMSKALKTTAGQIRPILKRLAQTHTVVLQPNGELWRAAPFSAVPTAFLVKLGRRSWYGNCIWDALGIPAMLGRDARIEASCGCCNYQMPLRIQGGKLLEQVGVIHFAVPARDWYKDIVFT